MEFVRYEKRGKIAYVMLNRPERRNALSPEMAEEMKNVWLDFKEDDSVWVAVVYGAGAAFCAGADIGGGKRPVKPAYSGGTGYTSSPSTYKVWKPVIGAMHGYVVGAGLWLALSCDIRIAATDAKLVLPEPKIGSATVYAVHLSQLLPMAIASELLLIGESMSAQRAYEVGIINQLVSPESLLDAATAVAEKLCQNSPMAVRAMKEMLLRGVGLPYEAQLALGEHIFEPIRNSEDYLEGRKAFAEKRKPVWKGR